MKSLKILFCLALVFVLAKVVFWDGVCFRTSIKPVKSIKGDCYVYENSKDLVNIAKYGVLMRLGSSIYDKQKRFRVIEETPAEVRVEGLTMGVFQRFGMMGGGGAYIKLKKEPHSSCAYIDFITLQK